MKTAKMFWQNQKTVLKKKNVYSSVSMNLRTVFKIFQKTDSLPKRLRTATDANIDQSDNKKKIKNIKKQLKTKKRLFKMFQKNKKQKSKYSLNEALKTAWIVIKQNDMYHQDFWKKSCFNDIIMIRMQIILMKPEF